MKIYLLGSYQLDTLLIPTTTWKYHVNDNGNLF